MKLRRSDYAILGLLRLGPGSGYDIKQRIDRSVAFFWNESYGQIYPRLKALEAEGLVKGRETPSARGGVRHVYSLTRRGAKALDAWIEEPVVPAPPRSELLLKLFIAGEPSLPALERHLVAHARDLRAELQQHAATHTLISDTEPGDVAWTLRRLTLDFGERTARAELAWAEHALEALGELT
ncbi:MAG: PadR family transcriptional regulator [Deltaproteobacteria bacterium]|jgi:DNA-binding PadR family transcriptional regulator|nr:PadR family transcriptional regulator [Deltaproteobacteria bacterium]